MLDDIVRLTEQCPPSTHCVSVRPLYDVSQYPLRASKLSVRPLPVPTACQQALYTPSTSIYLANQPSSHPCYSCIDRFCDLCQAKKPQFLWHCLDCGTSPGFDMCEECFNTAKSEPIRELASPMVACEVPLIHSTVTDLSLLLRCWLLLLVVLYHCCRSLPLPSHYPCTITAVIW